MRTGDTICLKLDYKIDGEDITQGSCDEMELQLNKDSSAKSLKKLLSNGDIVWTTVGDFTGYCVFLTQSETFALGNSVQAQLRIKKGDEVGSSPETAINLDSVLSSKVL